MRQALARVISQNEIVHLAYRDNMETISRIIPYLRERHMAAKKYLTVPYEDQEAAHKALFDNIEFCNKSIAIILGIHPENDNL